MTGHSMWQWLSEGDWPESDYKKSDVPQSLFKGSYMYGDNTEEYSAFPTYEKKKRLKFLKFEQGATVLVPDQIHVGYDKLNMQYVLELTVLYKGAGYKEICRIDDYFPSKNNSVIVAVFTHAFKTMFSAVQSSILLNAINDKVYYEILETNPTASISGKTGSKVKPGPNVQSLIPSVETLLGSDKKHDKSVMTVLVDCPAAEEKCGWTLPSLDKPYNSTVWYVIQHLNDHHKWPRETAIADWLDKLADDGIIDITIEIPDTPMEAE